jgi:hypothetical protein
MYEEFHAVEHGKAHTLLGSLRELRRLTRRGFRPSKFGVRGPRSNEIMGNETGCGFIENFVYLDHKEVYREITRKCRP